MEVRKIEFSTLVIAPIDLNMIPNDSPELSAQIDQPISKTLVFMKNVFLGDASSPFVAVFLAKKNQLFFRRKSLIFEPILPKKNEEKKIGFTQSLSFSLK